MRTWPQDHPKARLLERKQEAIKQAAEELFLQHGYTDTTMEMVAARAKVSIMTLYRHFQGKDVLFQAMIQNLCDEDEKEKVGQTFWEGEPSEVLRTLGRLRLAFFLHPQETALYRTIIGALEHFPDAGRMYYQISMEKAVKPLSTYLQGLHQHGTLHVPQPEFSARAFLSLLPAQMVERARLGAGPTPTDDEVARHIDACVTFFLSAHRPL